MQNKVSITGIKARDAALKGANYVADAVKSTIGPFGLNALTEKGNKSTNDGFLISQELCGTIVNEFERRGAVTLHNVSSKTNDKVADATSSSEALTQAITKEILRYLPNEKTLVSKKTPSEIALMLESSKQNVISLMEASKKTIDSKEELVKSALVSVEDETLAELIGATQWELGPDGIILAEETAKPYCEIEKVSGIRLDNGFGSSIVITNPEDNSMVVDDINVILTNQVMQKEDIMKLKDLIFVPLVQAKRNKIALIARAFSSEAIQLCMDSHKAGLFIYPINAPYVDLKEVMRDIGAFVGATYFDTEESNLEDIVLTDVGYASRIIARHNDAVIMAPDTAQGTTRVQERIAYLKKRLEGEASEFEKNNLQRRIQQLSGGFAILKVGAVSDQERKRLKDKADDAVVSTRLALKGGTIKGGGLAFKEIADTLTDEDLLKRPITCIYDQIMSSAPEGFVIEDWVRDPFITLSCALENACEGALILARTNIIVATENPHKCKCAQAIAEEESD